MDLQKIDHLLFIDSYTVPVIITDDDFNILYFNAAFSFISKHSKKRIKIGSSLFKYIKVNEEDAEFFYSQKKKKLVSINQEMNVSLKDKSTARVQVNIISTNDTDGNSGFIINLLDTSVENRLHEHFRLKKKLEELDREKTSFFQNVSHELRTPLTLIMNPLEELYKSFSDNDFVNLALKNSKRLYKLVNQILDVQKVSSKKKDVELVPTEICSFLKNCTDYFELACKKKKIKFKYKTSKNKKIFINAEIDFLEKIVFNLLSNALKFTPEKGSIEVKVVEKKNKVKIEVIDSGVGISPEEQKKLFKVFSQVSNDATKNETGSGLGLALAKDLTESMNGEIGVDSEKGKGSIFWLEFEQLNVKSDCQASLSDAQKWEFSESDDQFESTNDNTNKTYQEQSGASSLILVVDDLEDMRTLISKSLTEYNYRVATVDSAQKALEFMESLKPDVIITDLMMQGMDGYEFISELKKDSEFSTIPTIILSAKASSEEVLKGLEIGANSFLSKPFSIVELTSTIENLLTIKSNEKNIERLMMYKDKMAE
jgi:adenylate cyclase